jgi:exodeoxyribonuclease III
MEIPHCLAGPEPPKNGMPQIRLATWNINSVRLRAELVLDFLKTHAPDVLCLQETKCPDELFPAEGFQALGYVHQAIKGQKGYHGVAILSRLPIREKSAQVFCGKDDMRHISVTFELGLELHNFYVPAGGDVPDPEKNAKFAHKLGFLREMAECFSRQRDKRSAPVALVGDLNVAPLENDVWSHKQMLDVVSHTPVETGLLGAVRESFDWIDVTRSIVPPEQKIYSWWSYRARDWAASNRGRRLDHIWVSPGLKGAVSEHAILRDARSWTRPSDHVPVMATLTV